MDVIRAKSELSLKSSVQQLKGSVYRKIAPLRKEMVHEAAFIEAALDDPEHYSLEGYADSLLQYCENWTEQIRALIASASGGRLIQEGIRTTIIGKPNAGKSSLLNVLAQEDLAIVTEIAGTTRDIVSSTIRIGDVVLNVADTAGIRDARDKVEQIGIDRAFKAAEESDLILYVADSSVPIDEWDRKILSMLSGRPIIALLNKSDLEMVTTPQQIRSIIGEEGLVLAVSAAEGSGIEELKKAIEERFYQGKIGFNDEVIITNVWHRDCLKRAENSLELLKTGLESQMPEDICAIDLTDCIDALGEITGETMREDLIDEIFGAFCMGK